MKVAKELRDSPGWRGNVFYPDGPNCNGFGIKVLPDGRVWFPMIKADNEQLQKTSQETSQPLKEPVISTEAMHLTTPLQNVTDNFCLICGNPVPGKRTDRLYCSPKCRKKASRGKQLSFEGIAS